MAHDETGESVCEFICEIEHWEDQAFARGAHSAGRANDRADDRANDRADGAESREAESPEERPHWVSVREAAAEAQRAARKLRQREAYQRAKERRANDPRLQQLKLQQKEAAKARRREHYERVKQHRKAAKAAGKAVRSAERASTESAQRAFFAKGRVRVSKAELSREARELASAGCTAAAFADAVAANDIR